MTVEFRPARPSDWPRIQEFTKSTWSSGDYIGEVWESWLQDAAGPMYVATVDGRVVGLGKATMLSAREGWIEGIRVDPEVRRRGIGARLVEFGLQRCRELRAEVVRYATHSSNEPMHRVAAGLSFERVASYRPMAAEGLSERARVSQPGAGDLERLMRSLEPAAATPTGRPLYYQGRTWREPDQQTLAGHLARDEVIEWRRAWAVMGEGRDRRLELRLLVGPADELAQLAVAACSKLADGGPSTALCMAPSDPELVKALETVGFSQRMHGELWIYERAS